MVLILVELTVMILVLMMVAMMLVVLILVDVYSLLKVFYSRYFPFFA